MILSGTTLWTRRLGLSEQPRAVREMTWDESPFGWTVVAEWVDARTPEQDATWHVYRSLPVEGDGGQNARWKEAVVRMRGAR